MKKITPVLMFLAFCGVGADAATVHLKDGSRVDGTVVNATARDVKVQTDTGLRTIASDDIRRIDYAEAEESVAVRSPERRRRDSQVGDDGDERQMMSIGFGFATPLSRINATSAGGGSGDNGDTGFLLGTQYSYFLTPRLGAGFDLSFFNRSRTGSQSLLPNANSDVYGNTLLMMATLRYSLTDRGWARPFILGGVGTNRTSTILETTPNSGFAWSDTGTGETRTLVDDSKWGLATTARFGVDFMVAEPTIFTVELGWTGLSNSDYAATAAGRDLGLEAVKGKQDILTVAARWGWRF